MFGSPKKIQSTFVKERVYPASPFIQPKLSASRIKNLQDCSWEFYCSACLKLPERVWSKTFVGSLCHDILEFLAKDNPRRKEYVGRILLAKTYTSVPSIEKYVAKFKRKHPLMEDKHSVDLDELLLVALNYDFYFSGAKKILPPEFRFELGVGTAKIKGFLDRVAFYDGYAVIRDYKSQGKKFTAKELENNIQAAIYQLAIKQIFGVPARVEFILLRHGQKFLQVVEPYTESQINGLISYLEHLNKEFDTFTLDKARMNLRATTDKGFCNFVCGYRLPFEYYAATKDGKLIRTSKLPIEPLESEIVSQHFYSGCPYFFTGEGKARNFS